MYQALYRKYRPQILEDVVGQDIIVKILSNSILNDKISHAYLFCGPRGTGKTSVAKILSKIVNCKNRKGLIPCDKCESCIEFNNKNNTDILEIDAASNNGVDEIRELRNKINLVPTFGKYKVYIIDEVHMLTIGAFNALLKTLEEPPAHALFILATTEPHKIPITILSRCQRLDFKKISNESIAKRLQEICEKENIKYEQEALSQIANLCDGGMRDSISMLDKLVAYTNNDIKVADVNEINGLLTTTEINSLLSVVRDKKYKEMFEKIDKFNEIGKNFSKVIDEIIIYLRNILVFKLENDQNTELDMSNDEIIKYIELFQSINVDIKNSPNPKIVLETNLVKLMSNGEKESHVDKKNIKIETFEAKKKQKIEPISSDISAEISELKRLRVDNTLSKFNKKKLTEIKNNLENINTLLIDPDYSLYAGMLLDGNLKAASDENLIFVYESENISFDFNTKIPEIENTLSKINVNMKIIAVNEDEWNQIKQEFNSKTKSYVYKDDEEVISKLFKDKTKEEKNSIESMFDDIIKYN